MKISFGGWLGLICLAAFLSVALFYQQITAYVPHSEDEVAYLFQAKVFALNRLAVPTPANADAFWTPFVLDYQGQRFGKYAIGWPLLLSVGVRFGAPWLVNTVLATVTLALIAWLGRCFFEPCVGLWAAALAVVTPGFLFLSGSFLSHTASLFWSTLALVFVFHLVNAPDRYFLFSLAAGFSLGFVFITRPFAALSLGLPLGIFLLVLIWRGQLRWPVWLGIIMGGLPVAALTPLYWAAVTGDPTFNAYLLVWPYDRVGFGPDIGPWGYNLSTAIFMNTGVKLHLLATRLFGWPGWLNIVFLPLPFLARQAGRWDWLLLSTIGGVVFVHIFYWAFGGVDGGFPRYYYDALPALLLLTVRGIQLCFDYLRDWQWGRFQISWLLGLLLAGCMLYSLFWNLPPLLAAQKSKYGITPAPLQVVERASLSQPALVIVKNATDWHKFAVHFYANSPLLDGPVVYAINWNPDLTRRVREQFKDRVCWELDGETLRPVLTTDP